MRIDLLVMEGCPNAAPTRQLIRELLEELGVHALVEDRTVTTAGEAARLGFLGSPTVQIDGLDVERHRRADAGSLGCRLYRSRSGVSGIPPRELLAAAIEEALRQGGAATSRG